MDDVVRRTSSASATESPDSNLLRVQAHLPGRRHSDNTIQPPRILVAPPSPTASFSLSRGPSAANLHMRRHSSVGPQDTRHRDSFSFLTMPSKVKVKASEAFKGSLLSYRCVVHHYLRQTTYCRLCIEMLMSDVSLE